jgi:hypothetical protein
MPRKHVNNPKKIDTRRSLVDKLLDALKRKSETESQIKSPVKSKSPKCESNTESYDSFFDLYEPPQRSNSIYSSIIVPTTPIPKLEPL